MKVLVERTRENAVALTASLLFRAVQDRPSSVLGLATGGTMLAVYDHFIKLITTRKCEPCAATIHAWIRLATADDGDDPSGLTGEECDELRHQEPSYGST